MACWNGTVFVSPTGTTNSPEVRWDCSSSIPAFRRPFKTLVNRAIALGRSRRRSLRCDFRRYHQRAAGELPRLRGARILDARWDIPGAQNPCPRDRRRSDGNEGLQNGCAERTIFIPSAFVLEEGERLVVGGARRGARTYLAVRGGWQTPTRLGSRSSENRLRADDQLPAQAGWTPTRHLGPQTPVPADDPIRIIPGPDLLISLDPAWSYRVSPASDRMGIRLEGPSWPISTDPERISTPVAPGALQLAGGQPLLLGVACGTMGGYPHVAHVISSDFDRVAQLKAGDRVRFSTIELAEARHLDRAFREERGRWFQRIATAVGDVCGGV